NPTDGEFPRYFPVRGCCHERRPLLNVRNDGHWGRAASLAAAESAKLPVVFPASGNIGRRRVRTRLGLPPTLLKDKNFLGRTVTGQADYAFPSPSRVSGGIGP